MNSLNMKVKSPRQWYSRRLEHLQTSTVPQETFFLLGINLKWIHSNINVQKKGSHHPWLHRNLADWRNACCFRLKAKEQRSLSSFQKLWPLKKKKKAQFLPKSQNTFNRITSHEWCYSRQGKEIFVQPTSWTHNSPWRPKTQPSEKPHFFQIKK